MKKIALFSVLLLAGCQTQLNVEKTTEAASTIDALFTEHSNNWQKIFMAGKPSPETIAVVMAAVEDDRRKFHALMSVMVQHLASANMIDPVKFQQQVIDAATAIKDITGGRK